MVNISNLRSCIVTSSLALMSLFLNRECWAQAPTSSSLNLANLDDLPTVRTVDVPENFRGKHFQWSGLSVSVPFDRPQVEASMDGTAFFMGDEHKKRVVGLFTKLFDARREMKSDWGQDGKMAELSKSNCDFYHAVLTTTTKTESTFPMCSQSMINTKLMLRLKDKLYRAESRTGLYWFKNGNFCGFQVGDPARSDKLKVFLYTPQESIALLAFSHSTEGDVRFDQRTIDYIVGSLRQVGRSN